MAGASAFYAASHLQPLAALTDSGIKWRSTDIDLLADLPVIQGLMNLYRILKNPEHRLSWFSIRSPSHCAAPTTALNQLKTSPRNYQPAADLKFYNA